MELFYLLINKETNLTFTFDGKNVIQFINENDYITYKNEWFYVIYTKCKTEMNIFKEYLSKENYNEFSKYVKQQNQNSNEVIENDTFQLTNLIIQKDNENQKRKEQLIEKNKKLEEQKNELILKIKENQEEIVKCELYSAKKEMLKEFSKLFNYEDIIEIITNKE